MISWLLKEAWEKINIVATWRTIKALGKKYGKRFFWAALIWEIIEDVVFPFISWKMGVPELIPVFLILHFEPIVYPALRGLAVGALLLATIPLAVVGYYWQDSWKEIKVKSMTPMVCPAPPPCPAAPIPSFDIKVTPAVPPAK